LDAVGNGFEVAERYNFGSEVASWTFGTTGDGLSLLEQVVVHVLKGALCTVLAVSLCIPKLTLVAASAGSGDRVGERDGARKETVADLGLFPSEVLESLSVLAL
jgi:hypothetical protein